MILLRFHSVLLSADVLDLVRDIIRKGSKVLMQAIPSSENEVDELGMHASHVPLRDV